MVILVLLLNVGCKPKKTVQETLPVLVEETNSNPISEELIYYPDEEVPRDNFSPIEQKRIVLGNERIFLYLDSLRGKRVAILANQSSVIGKTHIVDSLLSLGINVVKVFAPEHGFRGTADAGEKIWSHTDPQTGLPIVSLYGSNKKPRPDQMNDVDIVLFDIQDVGVRFYTYISTLHYIMEACAENKKALIVLDRPNPNAHYIDGPIREEDQTSFIGMHPVPVVYGMTIGEYALMINGEFWLKKDVICKLSVVPCEHYSHKSKYEIPIAPSPNLRTDLAISLYPSLCFFEATTVSVGRGTEQPFEIYGHPNFKKTDFTFVPMPTTGAKDPLYQNKTCYGFDLKSEHRKRMYGLNLSWLINAQKQLNDTLAFINQRNFFDRLAGNTLLRKQITEGKSEKEIKESWNQGLSDFKKVRQKYLIYK